MCVAVTRSQRVLYLGHDLSVDTELHYNCQPYDVRPPPSRGCTYVHHPAEGLCELFLLATRIAKRGHGTLLLTAVERHLRHAGVRCIVCLAGEDTLSFWRKKGYTQEAVALKPQWWALLRDPFGSSKLTAKWLVGGLYDGEGSPGG